MHEIVSEVTVVQDAELGVETVEILGPRARVCVPCKCELRYLVLQIKDLEKHTSVEVSARVCVRACVCVCVRACVCVVCVLVPTVLCSFRSFGGVYGVVCLCGRGGCR